MKRAPSRKKDPRSLSAVHPSGSQPIPPAALSPGRKWLFRLLALFVLPLIVLGGLELLLRSLGLGFDPRFFKRERIGGRDFYVANDDFGLRFFPRELARIPPPVIMSATKPADTFRIFIFGESAALGDPRPNFGAGSYLEVLLAERFPQTKFEVINTGITAINSNVILPIAQECARREGDLWLIYMGNNEMVGPFGAATVFGQRAPPLWLIRARLQLQRLRLGQLLLELAAKVQKANPASAGWQGMEMFVQNQVAPDDPRKQKVYGNFQRNLEDILSAGLASRAHIVLSTVAVNLKDCPPFGALAGSGLSPANRAACDKLCQDGVAAERRGEFTNAEADFQHATEVYPQAAEAQFGLATCLLRLGNAGAARPHFLESLDDDSLPFRADSRINAIVRSAARRLAGKYVVLCDAAQALSAASPDGIPGEELFYEHVHLNPNGNFALALAWAQEVEKLLAPSLKGGARPSWLSQTECEQLLGLTDWNRLSILEEVLSRIERPPFSGQAGQAQRIARCEAQMDTLRKRQTSEAATKARETYSHALTRAPDNFRLHENYAEFLEATHELERAIAERNQVCALIPQYYFPYYSLGVDLKEAGRLTEARDALLKAAALRPEQGDVRLELGVVFARQGQWESARRDLELARRLNPVDPHPPLYLGEVLWKLEERSAALTALREAIRLNPSDWQPHYRLASDLAQQGSLADAAAEYREALRLNSVSIKSKLGLAAALLDLGREPEALEQIDQALELEPSNQTVLEFRRKVRGR